jgi:ATP/maltotriose-dependent transcriptional regulator MalT
LKAWLLFHRARITDLPALLDQIAGHLTEMSTDLSHKAHLRGECAALHSYLRFVATDVRGMRTQGRQALNLLPDEMVYARSLALGMVGFSTQMRGEFTSATAHMSSVTPT